MECGKSDEGIVMVEHPRRSFNECLYEVLSKSTFSFLTRQCQAEWDSVGEMCWPSAMPGTRVTVPCPVKPDINTKNRACRDCLRNGNWLTDENLDPFQPHTNYHDCFIFEMKELLIRLGEIGEDKPLIYEILIDPGALVFWIHVASIASLGVWFFIWLSRWRCERNRSEVGKYKYMSLCCIFLPTVNVIDLMYTFFGFHRMLNACYMFRILRTLMESLFYATLLFYTLTITVFVSQIFFSPRIRKFCLVLGTLTILISLGVEAWIEIERPPHNICVYGLYLNPFHWLVLSFKLWINGFSLSVGLVTLYGLIILDAPPASDTKTGKIMRQNLVVITLWVMYSLVVQMFPVFLDHMYNIEYSLEDVSFAAKAYNLTMASNGFVFAVLVCFLDVEMIAIVVPSVKKLLSEEHDEMAGVTFRKINSISNRRSHQVVSTTEDVDTAFIQ